MLSNLVVDSNRTKYFVSLLKRLADDNQLYWAEFPNQRAEYKLPFCFHLTIKYKEREYKAWSTDYDKDKAIFKCLMELIERIVLVNGEPSKYKRASLLSFKTYEIDGIQKMYPEAKNWIPRNSSGVAIHSNRKEVIRNGIAELIERHTILKAQAYQRFPEFG